MKRHLQGTTIIEVLIASFIFAGALFALASFQVRLMHDRSLLSQQAYALTMAQDKMQIFRNYTALTSTPGQFAYSDIVTGSSNTTVDGTTYNMAWTVTDSASGVTRKNVSITVTWTDVNGVLKNASNGGVQIDSVIARIDPALTGKTSEGLPP